MTLVVDASVALWACGAGGSFGPLDEHDLVAPWLMWSEFSSSLHASVWRRVVTRRTASAMLESLTRAPLAPRTHPELRGESWRVADEFGWAKTYDAEYVALASLLDCRLVTVDARLRRGADRLNFVVTPSEL